MDYRKEDIQANILKGHGRKYAGFIFFSFKHGAAIHRKRELLALFGRYEVTSYQKQLLDTQMFKDGFTEGDCFVKCLYISRKGFADLQVDPPLETRDESFEVGMNDASHAPKLGDYNTERDPYLAGLDGLVLVAHSSKEQVETEVAKVRKIYLDPVAISHCQYAEVETDENGFFKDHFGYSDGMSTPRDESVLAEYALVKETGNYSYGSFVAFRKIEQKLKHFEYMLYDLEVKLGKRKISNSNSNFYMALLMGRFPNGTPLTRFREERPVEEWIENDFDYEEDKEGSKCPLQSHIRMVNPRKKDENGKMISPPKIVRRSMRYEDKDSKGLCFLSYQSSIDNNFVPLFKNMGVNNDSKKDVITYRPLKQSDFLKFEASYSMNYGNPSDGFITQLIGGNRLTPFRGGEYFYAPSIPFLTDLENLGAPE